MPVDEMEYLDLVKEQAELKGRIEVQSNQLKAGAESFQEMRKTIQDNAAKPLRPLQLLGLFAGPFLAIAGFIWAASRYPERIEFDRLDEKVRAMEVHQVEVGRDIQDINRVILEMNKKLDRMLDEKATKQNESR
jgi:hypothetical protein